MKTLPLLLCAALVALPFQMQAQAEDPPPEPISLFEAVLGGTICIIAGTAVYMVYRTAKATQDKCGACSQNIPAKSYSCPSCGKAYRCELCGAKLAPTATQCGKCSTPVPAPKPPMKTLQSSVNGVDWAPAAQLDATAVFYDDLGILSFASQADFDAWRSAQTNIVSTRQLDIAPAAWFRLSSE